MKQQTKKEQKADMCEYKILVLGCVGKSALIILSKTVSLSVEVEGQQCMLDILDTADPEQFAAIRDPYMKNGQDFVSIYL